MISLKCPLDDLKDKGFYLLLSSDFEHCIHWSEHDYKCIFVYFNNVGSDTVFLINWYFSGWQKTSQNIYLNLR